MSGGIANLDDGPERPLPYLWADYVEVACLASPDKIATAQSVREAKLGLDVSGEDVEIFEDGERDLAEGAHVRARRADRFEEKVEDGFRHAEDRARQLGELYPFAVDAARRRLELRRPIEAGHVLYVALLLAANHRYVPDHFDALTRGFEEICLHALRAMLPSDGVAKLAGTTHATAPDGIPSASQRKVDRLKAMASLVKVEAKASEEQFRRGDSGDEGADLIAWIPMAEAEIAEEIVFLCQCATSNDRWESKQNDAAFSKWRNLLGLPVPNLNLLFLASSPRRYGGTFESGFIRSGEAVWLDRQRILRRLALAQDGAEIPVRDVLPEGMRELVLSAIGTGFDHV